MSLPRFTSFGHKVLVGHYEQRIEDFLPTAAPHGLAHTAWLYGAMRDEDDNLYQVLRPLSGAFTPNLVLRSNADGGPLQTLKDTLRTYKGDVKIDFDGKRITWSSLARVGDVGGDVPSDAVWPFEYQQTLDGATWREGDVLDLRARLLRPGMQWYDPAPGEAGFYALNVHQVEGTLFGRNVKGWYGYDLIAHPIGRNWQTSAYYQRLEVAYHTFANEYDDGSIEVGMLCHGNEGWCFAIGSDGEKPLFCETRCEAQIVEKPNGYPSEVLYTFGDQRWHWRADPRGELDDTPAGVLRADVQYRGAEGRCQPVGDTRRIVNGLGWIDYFVDGRAKGAVVEKLDL